MIKIYLDMDGVLADFMKEYTKFDPKLEDRKRFRTSVLDHKIFEKLDFMPDAKELLKHVASLGIHVEILTSMGTHDPFQSAAAKEQKLKWLSERGIHYKANFVHNKKEKAKYATPSSILIDDSEGCIDPFIASGGHGILHSNAADTIRSLNSIILQLKAIHA